MTILGPANAPPPLRLNDIIIDALTEIGVLPQGTTPQASDADFCRRRVNLILDHWGARRAMIFTVSFQLFTLIANKSPHTIGPTGDFVMAKRPVKLESAAVVVTTGSTSTDYPLAVKDDDWWAGNRVKGLAATLPTHVYYTGDFPNGSLYFWPVPQVANQVRLETWTDFTEFASADSLFQAPQGYRAALMYSLALSIFPSYFPDKQPSAVTVAAAQKAMSVVIGNNSDSPTISLTGQGDPTKARPDFNWLTGGPR